MKSIEVTSDSSLKKLMEMKQKLNIAYTAGMSHQVINSLENMIAEMEENLYVTEQIRSLKSMMNQEKEVITDPLPHEIKDKPSTVEKNPLRKKFNMPSFNKRFRDANSPSDITGTRGETDTGGFNKGPIPNT